MKKSIYWVDFSNNNPHFVNLAGLWMAEMGYQLKGYVTLRDGFTGHPEFNKSVVSIPFKPIAGLGFCMKWLMALNIGCLFIRSLIAVKLNRIEGIVYTSSWRYPKLDELYVYVAKASKIRVVLLFHEVTHSKNSSSSAAICKIVNYCDVLFSMSEHSRREIARAIKIDHDRILVTQHPHYGPLFNSILVDEHFRNELKVWLDGRSLLLFPSTVSKKRGSHFIKGYVDQIIAKDLNYKLLVVGRDEDVALADQLRMCEVKNPGVLKVLARRYTNEELKAALQVSSYVVLPYTDVMQSGVCPLALGEGVPVIASKFGSFVEIIEPFVNGVLVEVNELSQLSSMSLDRLNSSGIDIGLVRGSLDDHYCGRRFVNDLVTALKI